MILAILKGRDYYDFLVSKAPGAKEELYSKKPIEYDGSGGNEFYGPEWPHRLAYKQSHSKTVICSKAKMSAHSGVSAYWKHVPIWD